jgi:hypothetical protein
LMMFIQCRIKWIRKYSASRRHSGTAPAASSCCPPAAFSTPEYRSLSIRSLLRASPARS